MRKLFFAAFLSFGLASLPLALAAQHGAMAPAMAPPVMHAMPMHVAPVSGVHTAPAHSGFRPSSQVRPGIHTATPSVRSTVKPVVKPTTHPPRTAWHPVLPQPTLSTFPPFIPNGPILQPGNLFSGQSCFSILSCYPVPGLGFDYAHFFAVHPNWGNNFLTAGVVLPFGGGGGFFLPIPYYVPYTPQEEEAPANANAAEQTENTGNQQAVAEQPPAPAATPSFYPPSAPVYEYVFVKRDGTKIFAVAYSMTKDKLQYVTKEGLRRTLPLNALDFDATQKSNEERGNTVTLPTPPPSAMAQAF
jgi:hypothetical protein